MKIFKLSRTPELHSQDNRCFNDYTIGFVIIAKNEPEARLLAAEKSYDRELLVDKKIKENPWLNPKLTTCEEIDIEAYPKSQILLQANKNW